MRYNAGLLFLLALVGSVLLHELFHLAAARAAGMRVDRYFVGFGPTLWSRRVGEVTVGLKLLPLGGFVRIVGMDDADVPLGPLLQDLPEFDGSLEWWDRLEEGMRMRGVGRLRSRRIRDAARSRLPAAGGGSMLAVALQDAAVEELGPSRRIGDRTHRILRGDEGRLYRQRPHRARAAAILAGPLSHLLVAFLLLVAMQLFWPPRTGPVTSQIDLVAAGSPAELAGLQPVDRILAVDGTYSDDFALLREALRGSPGQPVTVVVSRQEEVLELALTPEPVEQEGRTVGVAGILMRQEAVPVSLLEAVQNAWSAPDRAPGGIVQITAMSAEGLMRILSPSGLLDVLGQAFGAAPRDPEGPISLVGAVSVASQVASSPTGGWEAFFLLLAAVNVFLLLFNLVPLPPFDGGHLAVTGAEAAVDAVRRIRRGAQPPYRMPERVLSRIAAPVYAVLVMLLLATLWLDVTSPVRL